MCTKRMQNLKELLDYLHTVNNVEALLDQEIDRLESEFNWDMKRCVYLQALECDAFHLDRLDFKMNRNQNLIQVYRKLLGVAFREKTILLNFLQNHQPISDSKENAQTEKSENKQTKCLESRVAFCTKPLRLRQDCVFVCCASQQPCFTPTPALPSITSTSDSIRSDYCTSDRHYRNRLTSKSHSKWTSDLIKFRRKTRSKCLPFKMKPKKRKTMPIRPFKLSLIF